MGEGRKIEMMKTAWRGIEIEVTYEADWLNMSGRASDFSHAHLQIRTLNPARGLLPITETGYRSHFLPDYLVREEGGPAGYVERWLNSAATSQGWRDREAASRQPDLFS